MAARAGRRHRDARRVHGEQLHPGLGGPGGEALGLTTEVLSDAVGAVNLRNRAGKADARAVHATLMALLHSNWAAVAATDEWCRALSRGAPLPCSNLVASAVAPF